jgi:hypothetical protein
LSIGSETICLRSRFLVGRGEKEAEIFIGALLTLETQMDIILEFLILVAFWNFLNLSLKITKEIFSLGSFSRHSLQKIFFGNTRLGIVSEISLMS